MSKKRGWVKRILLFIPIFLISIIIGAGSVLYVTWPDGAEALGLNISTLTRGGSISEKFVESTFESEEPIFVNLKPFTTTVSDGSRNRVIHLELTAQVLNESSIDVLTEYEPIIRDRILATLASENPIHIQTPEGRERLIEKLKQDISNPLIDSNITVHLKDVFFTAFVIQ